MFAVACLQDFAGGGEEKELGSKEGVFGLGESGYSGAFGEDCAHGTRRRHVGDDCAVRIVSVEMSD